MRSDEDRFNERVEKSGEHWLWTGVTDSRGYPWMWDSTNHQMVPAQVWIYMHVVGYRPSWGTPMQVCKIKGCVRPGHLEIQARDPFANVFGRGRPRKANDAPMESGQKTQCAWGHEYNDENTRVSIGKDGRKRRNCRVCDRERPTRKKATHGAHPG